MSDTPSPDLIADDRRRLRRRAGVAAILLVIAAAAAVAGIIAYVAAERERQQIVWQARLGIMADGRKAAIEDWLGARREDVLRIAQNQSLQLFLLDRAVGNAPAEALTAQQDYLRNLLVAEAERGGYMDRRPDYDINANIDRPGAGGMIVLDAGRAPIIATPHLAGRHPALDEVLDRAAATGFAASRVFEGADAVPLMGFAASIAAPQDENAAPVGFVLAVRRLDEGFFRRLTQPGESGEHSETMLAAREGDRIRYLSPLADGTAALGRTMEAASPGLAAAALVGRPSGFGEFRDYRGTEVLAVSREISGTDWTLIRKIERGAALGESERRLFILMAVLILGVLAVAAVVVAVWRHAVSDRLALAASNLDQAHRRAAGIASFLGRLADAVPNAILATDADGRVSFTNRAAVAGLDITTEDAVGKDLNSLMGPAAASPIVTGNARARAAGQPVTELDEGRDKEPRRVVQRIHVPLDDGGTLMVAEDLTRLVEEREARGRQLNALVGALVSLIDARDPFAADHSKHVADIAGRLARHLDYPAEVVEAAETAARLMNLGKIAIDPRTLTRSGTLTDDELADIRMSVRRSAELIQNVPFDAPVVETLRQLQERYDGHGMPDGLAGDQILPSARIVAVANAFVAMTSDRAHRRGLTPSTALDQLWSEAGHVWDRRVVAGLVDMIEGRHVAD